MVLGQASSKFFIDFKFLEKCLKKSDEAGRFAERDTINTGLLDQVVETGTPTKKKKYERWQNVEGIFSLNPKHTFENVQLYAM